MIILDTDCVTHLQRGSGDAYVRLSRRLAGVPRDTVRVSIISFEEQMRGWLAFVSKSSSVEQSVHAYRRLLQFANYYKDHNLVPFDDVAAVTFVNLRKSLPRSSAMDLKIASIALVQNAILVSRNILDFQHIPSLCVEDWTRP